MNNLFCVIFSLYISLSFTTALCAEKNNANNDSINKFSFVFMTDIHLAPERGAQQAFEIVIDTINKLNADFVMTGGDNVYDVLRGNFNRSDCLFASYKNAIESINIPVYNCIGNHELFGIYEESDIDSLHPDYKYGMFERYFGDTYYSFDHKGWHFIVLNSIDEKDKKYIGVIDDEQILWIKEDLAELDPKSPIVIVTHLPLVSVQKQVLSNNTSTEVSNELWIGNSKEVLDLFKDHNLKLVLQGHLHWVEDINVMDKTRFITGGAVAGRPSWRGSRNVEEGFMLIKIDNNDISWDYIDYGWEPK